MTSTITPSTADTLGRRLSQGRLSVPEALQLAVQLADRMRKMHESGYVHGAVSPDTVASGRGGLEVTAAEGGGSPNYIAPEVLAGSEADVRSDIYSFGTVVYEMLTGRRAFEGDGMAAVLASAGKMPTPSGRHAGLDRVVAGCVARDPDARWQRMNKVYLELRLLSAESKRSDTDADELREQAAAERAAELQQFEKRLEARLQTYEKSMLETRMVAEEAFQSVADQITSITVTLAEVQQASSAATEALAAVAERTQRIEQELMGVRDCAYELEQRSGTESREIERKLGAQTAAIETTRTQLRQTDDLVERVVEALEALQTLVLDQAQTGSKGRGGV